MSEKYFGLGLGIIYLKFLGFKPGPFENKFHYLIGISSAFLLIVEHIKNEYSFLCASKSALEMLVNIIFVILSLSLDILMAGTMPASAFFKPCSYSFLTYPKEN